MAKTAIIGGGIIGLFSAYYLLKEGREITIFDAGKMEENCSTGNAGMIVPSHIVPLASPGMIAKGVRWMFSRKSPFYIHPRLDKKLLDWCLLFYKNANAKHVEKSIPTLKNLNLLSKSLYIDFDQEHSHAGIWLQQKGLLMLYKTKHIGEEETDAAHLAKKYGLEAEILGKDDVQKLEPNQEIDALGGVLYPGDAHLSPNSLYRYLKQYLQQNGVKFNTQTQVLGFIKEGSTIKGIKSTDNDFYADEFLICSGSHTGTLASKLGLRLPLIGGKGYSFVLENKPEIKNASILVDGRVSVSPYGNQVRFGGTMEIAGAETGIDEQRVDGIYQSIQSFYPNYKIEKPGQKDIWSGLRPCSPDGIPYMGKLSSYSNIFVASGHGMMGLSLAPVSGKIMSQIISGQPTELDISACQPERFN